VQCAIQNRGGKIDQASLNSAEGVVARGPSSERKRDQLFKLAEGPFSAKLSTSRKKNVVEHYLKEIISAQPIKAKTGTIEISV